MTRPIVAASLGTALIVETLVIVALGISARWPDRRIWPPGKRDWRLWFYWGSVGVVAVSLLVVAVLTAAVRVEAARGWIAIATILAGLAVAGWAARTLRVATSVGLAADLHTDGPYRYSRNPQLVGFALALTGLAVLIDSRPFTVGLAPTVVWLWLLPRAEEPWLETEFGDAYRTYRESVPRFVGVRSIRRLLE